MGYSTETIKNVVYGIRDDKFLLPAIQRELVWDHEQIEKLFDSILSGYPFGSMLFWKYKIDKENSDYKFYRFIKKYDEYNKQSNHNEAYPTKNNEDIIGVLDGQQRLTALYLGLLGYLNLHKQRTKWDNADNFEIKHLYIDLLYKKQDHEEYDDIKPEYGFKFKTQRSTEEEENKDVKKEVLWFKVENILSWNDEIDHKNVAESFNLPRDQERKVEAILFKLYQNFINKDNKRISFYEEDTSSLDKILNIFVRINSGGTPLDYTDFLMSMIVNQWGDGKEKINDAVDGLNDYKFRMPKDIFLRGCLFLTGADLNFRADNFKKDTISNIKTKFDDIRKYIRTSCEIFNKLGYNSDNLRSNLILLPLAFYLMQNQRTSLDNSDLRNVKRWIQLSILNRVFGSQTTSYLKYLRDTIKDNKNKQNFPLDEIIEVSNKHNRNMEINEDRLDEIIQKAKKGSQDSWALLTLLYPDKKYGENSFHEDHIFPYSRLSKDQKANGGDFIVNLQLLPGNVNQGKGNKEPNQWIREHCNNDEVKIKQYKEDNFIPQDIELTINNFNNFDAFIKERKVLLRDEILKKLRLV